MNEYLTLALVAVVSIAIGYFLASKAFARRIDELEARAKAIADNASSTIQRGSSAGIEAYKSSADFHALLSFQNEKGKSEGAAKSVAEYKTSDEFTALLSLEHAKGKRDGAMEEMAKFHITYTPILVDHETFFSHKVDIGYDMQLHYAGFPVGEPTRRITNHREQSKDENVLKLVDSVTKTLEIVASAAGKHHIPVTISRSAKRVGN